MNKIRKRLSPPCFLLFLKGWIGIFPLMAQESTLSPPSEPLLPVEVWGHVFSFCTMKEKAMGRLTCKTTNDAVLSYTTYGGDLGKKGWIEGETREKTLASLLFSTSGWILKTKQLKTDHNQLLSIFSALFERAQPYLSLNLLIAQTLWSLQEKSRPSFGRNKYSSYPLPEALQLHITSEIKENLSQITHNLYNNLYVKDPSSDSLWKKKDKILIRLVSLLDPSFEFKSFQLPQLQERIQKLKDSMTGDVPCEEDSYFLLWVAKNFLPRHAPLPKAPLFSVEEVSRLLTILENRNYPRVFYYSGIVWKDKEGDSSPKAQAYFQEAINLPNPHPDAFFQRGWYLICHPSYEDSPLDYFQEAIQRGHLAAQHYLKLWNYDENHHPEGC